MAQPQTTVIPFRTSDVSGAFALSAGEGWNQTLRDWQRILEYEPDGCFAAVCSGELAGTVTTTRYGDELAWIGMMLVHPERRRLGIATELMRVAIDFLHRGGVECIKLDATPAGEKVYRELGFVPEFSFHRWSRDSGGTDQPTPGSAEAGPLSDYRVFGADRSEWLEALARDSQVRCVEGGFGMIRPGRISAYLGPVTADSASVARSIIDPLLDATSAPVFWDIPGPNQAAAELARALGFVPVRDLTRMRLGPDTHRPDLRRQFAIADPGVG